MLNNRISLTLLALLAFTSSSAFAAKSVRSAERVRAKSVTSAFSVSTVVATNEAYADNCFDEQANVDFWRDMYWLAVSKVNDACGDGDSGPSVPTFGTDASESDDSPGGGLSDCALAMSDMEDTAEIYAGYLEELNDCMGG